MLFLSRICNPVINTFCDFLASLFPAPCKAGPVIEVNDTYLSAGRYDAVTAINRNIQHFRSPVTVCFQFFHIKGITARFTIDGFQSEFAVATVPKDKTYRKSL